MKIAIGMNLQSGPFGGGNQFGKSLANYLTEHGEDVVFNLNDTDIDIILLTEPRKHLASCAFDTLDILNYINNCNKTTLLVHRINECDERKGTKTVNKQLILASSIVDHTVYIASWLINLFKKQGLSSKNHSIILNGADETVFKKYNPDIKKEGASIVTHHWGAAYQKGWDIYKYLDELLEQDKYQNIKFHYIGNHLDGYIPKNIIYHTPKSGEELARALSLHDIYLTASINEPAGMHHIEGALCGLPILYRNSGALPEYCDGYGVIFNGIDDFEDALNKLLDDLPAYQKRMSSYNNTATVMTRNYHDLFKQMYQQKDIIIQKRNKRVSSFLFKIKLKLQILYIKLLNKLRIL